MSAVDHRARAEEILRLIAEPTDPTPEQVLSSATVALAHATLDAGRPLDSGLRDLLSAARTLIAHTVHDVHHGTVVVLPGDFDALVGQVNEATEAGL